MARGKKAAKLKLVRAAKHLRAIKLSIAAYSRTKPHKIVRKSKSKKKLNIPKSPPAEIAILAGEMIYQMRSALDYLAFELVKRNPNIATIDPKWEEHVEFPLRINPPKNGVPFTRKDYSKCLPGISDAAFAIIDSLQPYHGVGTINNALRFLAHLSNIDKHRHLNLIKPRVVQFESVRYPHGLSGRGHATLDRGAEINPTPPQRSLSATYDAVPDKPMYVKRHYRTLVAFNERRYLGDAATLPVDYLLQIILESIQTFAVPALDKLIKQA